VILTKQEWRAKEKVATLALVASDESPLIKYGSLSPTGMDFNMVFTLPAEFIGVKDEVAQMCLSPKEAVFEKPKESNLHLKPLYVCDHIDRKPISRMLIDGSAVVNLMSYSTFVIPYSEKAEMKPSYMCPGCSNHMYNNNMIKRCHV
jgi:hypothetical protein